MVDVQLKLPGLMAARQSQGVTRSLLAEELGDMHTREIWQYEINKRLAPLETAKAFAEVLCVPLERITG